MEISPCCKPSITPCRQRERMGSASVTFEQAWHVTPWCSLELPQVASGSRGGTEQPTWLVPRVSSHRDRAKPARPFLSVPLPSVAW